MKKGLIFSLVLAGAAALFSSCSTVVYDGVSRSSSSDADITVGKVQKEIRKGMSGAEVSEVLGAPNIVTKDADGDETWVYDKIASSASYSDSRSALFLLLGGVANRDATATYSQQTLTVVIKFDKNGKVKSFSYHASKF